MDQTAFPEIINALEQLNGDAVLSYGLNKRPEQKWNVVIGVQYQMNKMWMFRSEAGIIGDRKSFLASVNYRFRI